MLKQLYYTLIYPYLNYGLDSWGAAYKTRLHKICTKQNRCIRSMFFANGREHVTPYYNLLGILKFENIYRLKVSLFAYKFKNEKSNTQMYYWIFLHLHQRSTPTIPCMLQIKTSLSHQYALNMAYLHLNSPQQKSGNLSH